MKKRRGFRLILGEHREEPKQSRSSFLFKNLTEKEKESAAFFPLFGNPGFDQVILGEIIRRHGLTFFKIEELSTINGFHFSIRTHNCLLKSGIKSLGTVLMMTPQEILAIKNIGKRAVGELQEIARHILGI